MSKIISFAKTIRRNWKKSTLLFGVLAYGIAKGNERYRTFNMMRAYCEEAKEYGEKTLGHLAKPKHITIILNPTANNNKAVVQFEKFAAPLLHLAGFKVSVFQTESEKQAEALMEIMGNTDAVIIAGGDGTLQEAITGLMRRPESQDDQLPIGVCPIGRTNSFANHLFATKSSSNAQLMAESVMAVIRETMTRVDVMKIQSEDEEKPIYAMCSFQTGLFADIESTIEKYWYLGSLKDKFAYFTNSLKNTEEIQVSELSYIPPCNGCSRCFVKHDSKKENQKYWWSGFLPKKIQPIIPDTSTDFSNVINEECGKKFNLKPAFSNLCVSTSFDGTQFINVSDKLWVKVHSPNLSLREFIYSGLKYRKMKLEEDTEQAKLVQIRELNILTETELNPEKCCYIDGEKYKMSSYHVSLLPKKILMYA